MAWKWISRRSRKSSFLKLRAIPGKDAEHWVKDVALRAVEETTRFRAAVRQGVAQADRGELIDDDEIHLWLERQKRS